MFIEIPDEFEVTTKDFEAMTLVLAKFLMALCTREPYRIYMENDPANGKFKVKKEYVAEKLVHEEEPAPK